MRHILFLSCGFLLLLAITFAGFTYQLNETALNSDFVERQVRRLDLEGLEKRLILTQLSPAQQKVIGPGIERALAEARSRILDQLLYLCVVTTQYVRGADSDLSYLIDREPLRKSVRMQLRLVVAEFAAEQLRDVPDDERESTLDAWTDDLMQGISIPDYWDKEDLPMPFLEDLETARFFLSPFNGADGEAIFACLVLTGLLWWLGSMRAAGVLLTVGGLLSYVAGYLLAVTAMVIFTSSDDAYFEKKGEAFIRDIVNDFHAPASDFALICFFSGLFLVAASILRRKPATRVPPLPDLALQSATSGTVPSQPPRVWYRRTGNRVGIVFGLLLIFLTPNFIDLYHRKQVDRQVTELSENAESQGAQNNWGYAMRLYHEALQLRWYDAELKLQYQQAANKWLESIDADIARLKPAERWSYFLRAEAQDNRAHAPEEFATGYDGFVARNLSLLQKQIERGFIEAGQLLEVGLAEDAERAIEPFKDVAAAHPEFHELLQQFQAAKAQLTHEPKAKNIALADAIMGAWTITSLGGEVLPADVPPILVKFIAGEYFISQGTEELETGRYVLDEVGPHAKIDFLIRTGEHEGKSQHGIITLRGKKLSWCISAAGSSARPSSFGNATDGDVSAPQTVIMADYAKP